MKLKFWKLIMLVPITLVALSACNASSSDDDDYTGLETESSTIVKSFSIKANAKVLANLDSVFFSIDQVKGEIYNADSLPWGTDVRKLVVSVQIPSTSAVEVVMPRLSDGTDTIINLLEDSSDSINFSMGSVWLRVTSADAEHERVYTCKVNVHNCNPDSLQWNMKPHTLPSILSNLTAQRSVEYAGKYYCMSTNGSKTVLSEATHPGQYNWDCNYVTDLPEDAVISSLTANTDAMYMVTESGKLIKSVDGFAWETVEEEGWTHIYGSFQDEIVGVKDGKWVCYPSGLSGDIPEEMPVSETSDMWTFTNDWAIEPQAMIACGVKANGEYSENAWGFDGETWARLSGLNGTSSMTLPKLRQVTLFPYFTFKTNTSTFVTSRHSSWIAMGGQYEDGTINSTVYLSLDNGLNWNAASEDMQLPSEMKPRRDADVILCYETYTDETSRAVTPITEWDTPYIYMFGGYLSSGSLSNQVWTGVVNRLIFKPLQ